MRKSRRVLLILVTAGLLAGVTLLVWPWNTEPEYGGKKLSVWLGPQYLGSSSISDKDKADAIEAIGHMGTNALPCLLDWLAYETPARTKKLFVTLDRPPLRVVQRALVNSDQLKQIQAGRAVLAFQILGPVAKPALPELNRFLTNRSNLSASARARECMRFIGREALPFLLSAATNSQTPFRERLLWPIAYSAKQNGDPSSVVPVLADMLKDQDTKVAEEAATSLAYIGGDPPMVVQALMKAAQDRRPNVRARAVQAFEDFSQHARPAVPVLVRCLDDPFSNVQISAIRTLGALRLEPKLVVPALIKCMDVSDRQRQAYAAASLARFGHAAAAAGPAILPLLDDPTPRIRQLATNALKEIAPEKLTEAPNSKL